MLGFVEPALGRLGVIPFAEECEAVETALELRDQFILAKRAFEIGVDLFGGLPFHRQPHGSGEHEQLSVVVDVASALLRQQEPDRVSVFLHVIPKPLAEDALNLLRVIGDHNQRQASIPTLRLFLLVELGPRIALPLPLQDDDTVLR